ncbi:Ras- protein Rab-8A [Podila epigama]|nr:Ras- protein Rab-8A [Podila epigama]
MQHNVFMGMAVYGDSAVGKTCLIQRFVHDTFTTEYVRSEGVEFESILLVYDVTNERSFQSISDFWISNLFEPDGNTASQFRILVGNKADNVPSLMSGGGGEGGRRVVSREQGQALADSLNIPFFETSAKSNICVEDVFLALARDCKKGVAHRRGLMRKTAISENSASCIIT